MNKYQNIYLFFEGFDEPIKATVPVFWKNSDTAKLKLLKIQITKPQNLPENLYFEDLNGDKNKCVK